MMCVFAIATGMYNNAVCLYVCVSIQSQLFLSELFINVYQFFFIDILFSGFHRTIIKLFYLKEFYIFELLQEKWNSKCLEKIGFRHK